MFYFWLELIIQITISIKVNDVLTYFRFHMSKLKLIQKKFFLTKNISCTENWNYSNKDASLFS